MPLNNEQKSKIVLEAKDTASVTIKKVNFNYKHMVGSFVAGTVIAQGMNKVFDLLRKSIGQLKDATKVAARIQVLNRVFFMTGQNAKWTRDQLENMKQQMMALGIAEQEALEIGQRFIQSQLDIADATKVARAAQDLAVIAGTNSSETALRLTEAIVKQRPILLKQFGIIANLNDIYGRQATALNKTVEALTETEKRSAFLNEILRQSKTVAGAYESAMNDVGKRMTSLPRFFQNAQKAVGQHFLPAMEVAVDSATDFLKAVEAAFAPKTDLLVKSLVKLQDASRRFADTSVRVNELRDEYANLLAITDPTADEQERLNQVLSELEKIMPGVVLQFENQGKVMRTNLETLDDLIDRQHEANEAAEQQALSKVADRLREVTRSLKEQIIVEDNLRETIFGVTHETDNFNQTYEKLQEIMPRTINVLQETLEGANDLTGGMKSTDDIIQQVVDISLSNLNNSLKTTTTSISGLTDEQDRLLGALSNMFPVLLQNAEAQVILGDTITQLVLAYQELEESTRNANEAAKEGFQVLPEIVTNYMNALIALQEAGNNAFTDLGDSQKQVAEQGKQIEKDLEALADRGTKMRENRIDRHRAHVVQTNKDIIQSATGAAAATAAAWNKAFNQMGAIAKTGISQIADTIVDGRGDIGNIFKSMAADFAKFFIKQALASLVNLFIPGLGSILGGIFDTPANDRMAMTQGRHFSQWFTAGALDELSSFPLAFAGAATGSFLGGAGGTPALTGSQDSSVATGGITLVFNGPVSDKDFIDNVIIPTIEEATQIGGSKLITESENITGEDDVIFD